MGVISEGSMTFVSDLSSSFGSIVVDFSIGSRMSGAFRMLPVSLVAGEGD